MDGFKIHICSVNGEKVEKHRALLHLFCHGTKRNQTTTSTSTSIYKTEVGPVLHPSSGATMQSRKTQKDKRRSQSPTAVMPKLEAYVPLNSARLPMAMSPEGSYVGQSLSHLGLH